MLVYFVKNKYLCRKIEKMKKILTILFVLFYVNCFCQSNIGYYYKPRDGKSKPIRKTLIALRENEKAFFVEYVDDKLNQCHVESANGKNCLVYQGTTKKHCVDGLLKNNFTLIGQPKKVLSAKDKKYFFVYEYSN